MTALVSLCEVPRVGGSFAGSNYGNYISVARNKIIFYFVEDKGKMATTKGLVEETWVYQTKIQK